MNEELVNVAGLFDADLAVGDPNMQILRAGCRIVACEYCSGSGIDIFNRTEVCPFCLASGFELKLDGELRVAE